MLDSALYVICDDEVCARSGWALEDFAAACLDGGARLLQVRVKRATGGALFDTSLRIVERARACGAVVIVNDRADVARLTGAAGVHVGQDDLTPAAVREILGPDAVVGLSTHTPEQGANALQQPVSYMAVGPVFETRTKATGYSPIGLEAVQRAAGQISSSARPDVPLVAIGGITLGNAASVLQAGARSVAVISDLLTAAPADRVRQFLRALGESH